MVGGVIEYGVPPGVWAGEQDALAQTIPNEEIDVAIDSGCSYLLYWNPNPNPYPRTLTLPYPYP